jgi:hypothetical protein
MLRFNKRISQEDKRRAKGKRWRYWKRPGNVSDLYDMAEKLGFEPELSQFLNPGDNASHPEPMSMYPLKIPSPENFSIFYRLIDVVDRKHKNESSRAALEWFDDWLVYHFRTLFFRSKEVTEDRSPRYWAMDYPLPMFYPTDFTPFLPQGWGVGIFDDLDQPICNMARLLGFDTIVLQHEIGGHACCTKIIHTGDFQASLLYARFSCCKIC